MAGAKGFMVYAPEVSQTSKENTMNTFCEHHKDSIRFQYACFDRILLNGVIEMLLPPERAQRFFSHHQARYLTEKFYPVAASFGRY